MLGHVPGVSKDKVRKVDPSTVPRPGAQHAQVTLVSVDRALGLGQGPGW